MSISVNAASRLTLSSQQVNNALKKVKCDHITPIPQSQSLYGGSLPTDCEILFADPRVRSFLPTSAQNGM